MITKSDTVRELVINGDYKRALSIAKDFRIRISKEDLSKMALAYECLVHTSFYEQLGVNTATAITDGIQVLKSLYGQSED